MSKSKHINPVAAAGVGAGVGAALGAAVGVGVAELTDEKSRKSIQRKFGQVGQEGKKLYSEFTKQPHK